MEHYCCYKTFVPSTQAERITDTVAWFPHQVTFPTQTPLEIIAAATRDILQTLKKPLINSPLDLLNDTETTALQNTVSVLHNKITAQQSAPLLRVPTETQEPPAPPLRVTATEAPTPNAEPVTVNPVVHLHTPQPNPSRSQHQKPLPHL